MTHLYRRIATMASLSLWLAGAVGCSGEDLDATGQGEPESGSMGQSITANNLQFRVDTDTVLPVEEEHCRFSATRRDAFGAGRQVLVSSTTGTLPHLFAGLCTVDTAAHDGGVDDVHVTSDDFRHRLEVATGNTVTGYATNQYPGAPEGFVAKPLAKKVTGTTDPGFGEYWRIPAASTARRVAYAAPHGGEVEPGTDEQIVALDISDTDPRNAYWAVLGEMNAPDGGSPSGASDHWHITSSDLSQHSFQGLRDLRTLSYSYAVSFHGFTGGSIPEDVIVGGNETPAFRNSVARILEHEVAVRHNRFDLDAVAPPANCDDGCLYRELAGQSTTNFVNVLPTSGRGLQLEQTRATRDNQGTTIARAVKSVMDCLLDVPDDELVNSSSATTSLLLDDVGEVLTTGTCPYFVGELDMLHGAAQRWRFRTTVVCGSTGCADKLGRVDAYHDNADGTWSYVGGGALAPTGSGTTASMVSDITVNLPASTPRQYRFVVRASNVTTAPTLPTVQRGITLNATRL
ncbi:poly-gamma-glutamate hydrolase family protein [Pyxidicoccus sp. 3LG]